MIKKYKNNDRLPEILTHNAFHEPNGEYAWKKDDIINILNELAKLNYATLGGEIWGVKDNKIYGVLPSKSGGIGVYSWHSKPKKENEDWNTFVQKCLRENIETINNLHPEQKINEEFINHIYYNLCYVDEQEYKEL